MGKTIESGAMSTPATGSRSRVAPHRELPQYYGNAPERRRFVDELFDTTARDYEWINSIMSFGSGPWYRRDALERSGLRAGMKLLDVCVGTGLVGRSARQIVGDTGAVFGLDASMGMLAQARVGGGLDLVQAYAEALPIRDQSLDFVSMGYALRHVADLVATFEEYRRVLKPGGRLMILEITRPRARVPYLFTRLYMSAALPVIARLRGRKAQTLMQYFWDTIDQCVSPEEILQALVEAGFRNPERQTMFDTLSEYTAER